ncbi:Centromere protein U [Sciurus carolinensis]|uniref:Centromere protein U n=1 Tax=Sciurus carolinensis TaxID=30640 RepID=A0AA41N7D3_SCICA|nr:Centromere protein U [Sciurus carolinensis]
MTLQWRVSAPPPPSPPQSDAGYSKNTLGRTRPMKDKADHKHRPTDIFDFPDNSDISSIGNRGENEKDEEPYETFDPPLHSTAIQMLMKQKSANTVDYPCLQLLKEKKERKAQTLLKMKQEKINL